METQRRRLYRSRTNRVVAGICGGIGEYMHADPTLIRLAWVLMTFLGGSGILLYIIAYFVIPLQPIASGESNQPVQKDFTVGRIFGILFVVVGVLILLDNLEIISFHRWWHLSWDFAFPAFLVLVGVYFLIKRRTTLPPATEPTNEPDSSDRAPGVPSEAKSNARTLRRSHTNKKILGICAGLGEYFDIDPTIVRVAYALFTVFSGGVGIVLYFLLYLIMPEEQPQTSGQG